MRREDELAAEVDRVNAAEVDSIREALTPEIAMSMRDMIAEAPAGVDIASVLTQTAAPAERYNRLTNSTWRLLEEQRVDALETVAEIDAQIRALNERREDAVRAADMCAAAQKAAG